MVQKEKTLETADQKENSSYPTQKNPKANDLLPVYYLTQAAFLVIIGYIINALITSQKMGLSDIDLLFLAVSAIICILGWAFSSIRFFKLLSGNFVRRIKD